MAKTESTAVNDLIALVNQPPLRPSPAEELHFDARQRPAASTTNLAPRVTNNVSMAPSSATVAPLPRSRAPHGTASNLVPPRRSTALPPPRPSAQMAVPAVPVVSAAPPVTPPAFVRTAWPMMPADGSLTEPIEHVELSFDLDAEVDAELDANAELDVEVEAVAFDDDEIAFDGDPNAPVPTSVMPQNEIDRLADQSLRAVATPAVEVPVARLDEGWTPNFAAPLTLDDSDSDFAISETSPFLQDKHKPAVHLDDSAVIASAGYPHRAASAPVIAMAPLPRPRATSATPVQARPSVAQSIPALPDAIQTGHLDPAALPALPRAAAMSWPTDFGPTAVPANIAVVETSQASAAIAAPKLVSTVAKPNKIVAMLPLAGGLAVVALFAGGYFYFNNQQAKPPTATSAITPAAAPAVAAVDEAMPTVTPSADVAPAMNAEIPAPAGTPAVGDASDPTVATPALAPVVPSVPSVPAAPTTATTESQVIAAPAPLPPTTGLALQAATAPAVDATASLVTIRFESKPAGATVTLVDRGRTSLIGTTPINASLDSHHKYEIVFSLDGRATKIAKLDPQKSRTVKTVLPAVSSSHRESGNTSTAVAAIAPRTNQPAAVTSVANQQRVATKSTTTGQAVVAKEIAAVFGPASEVGTGIVMISSKPPCEIVVDGKATGLMTPQRNLTMTAGRHTITLLNKPNGIKKNLSIQVSAGKSTKLVQDYSALIKN